MELSVEPVAAKLGLLPDAGHQPSLVVTKSSRRRSTSGTRRGSTPRNSSYCASWPRLTRLVTEVVTGPPVSCGGASVLSSEQGEADVGDPVDRLQPGPVVLGWRESLPRRAAFPATSVRRSFVPTAPGGVPNRLPVRRCRAPAPLDRVRRARGLARARRTARGWRHANPVPDRAGELVHVGRRTRHAAPAAALQDGAAHLDHDLPVDHRHRRSTRFGNSSDQLASSALNALARRLISAREPSNRIPFVGRRRFSRGVVRKVAQSS
jgi:hypothetical protein